uniref:Uncharacterized protein n=1 Tax=Panagrolaimus sp. ES5 TaxID=591445 RepID=A0AC34FWS0_9BILA
MEKKYEGESDERKKLSKEYDDLHEDYLKINDKMNCFVQKYDEEMTEKDNCISKLKSENEMLKEEIRKLQSDCQQKEAKSEEELNKEKRERKEIEIKMDTYLKQVNEIKDVVKNWQNEEKQFGRKRVRFLLLFRFLF